MEQKGAASCQDFSVLEAIQCDGDQLERQPCHGPLSLAH
jgi:hypothetical protein